MGRGFKSVMERLCSEKDATMIGVYSSEFQRVLDQEMAWITERLKEAEGPREPKRSTRDYIQFLDSLSQGVLVVVSLFSHYSLLCELAHTIISVFPNHDHPWIVEYSDDTFSVILYYAVMTVVPSLPTISSPVQCSLFNHFSID